MEADFAAFLNEKVKQYNNPAFIASDPISIPHLFQRKEDIEIAGFLAATIAWGQRTTILKNANWLMQQMGFVPYEFIMQHRTKDLQPFQKFVHRTFNGEDTLVFIRSLRHIYTTYGGLEEVFSQGIQQYGNLEGAIHHFRKIFFEKISPGRTGKHVADPLKNSSAKRICMFLRWMVRNDKAGVDFGIWKKISPSVLHAPLDLHSGNTARKLGLLTRKQDDWKSVTVLTENLRRLDPADPVKYDFALYGLGVFEKF